MNRVAIGDVFHRLTVVELLDGDLCACRCSCGTVISIRQSRLWSGNNKSCGCLKLDKLRARSTKHGGSVECLRTYRIWKNMRQRCTNPNNRWFHRYGGRGITFCERWDSFANFLADMGPCPEKLTLERRNNNIGYQPDNCIWADMQTQATNRSNNKFITFNGETLTHAAWAKRLGGGEALICNRLRLGWTEEEAVTTPVQPQARSKTAKSSSNSR